jgi:hypothetical protein
MPVGLQVSITVTMSLMVVIFTRRTIEVTLLVFRILIIPRVPAFSIIFLLVVIIVLKVLVPFSPFVNGFEARWKVAWAQD